MALAVPPPPFGLHSILKVWAKHQRRETPPLAKMHTMKCTESYRRHRRIERERVRSQQMQKKKHTP